MKQKNKYVNFVSDEHFLDCINWVCEVYPVKSSSIDMEKLQRNTLDPFKIIFDITNNELSVKNWIKNEVNRQSDKSINNRIGDFHQKLLGGVEGWEDLGRGHPLGVDLKNKDDSIFIELKNKHNTVKGEDLKNVFDKLKKVANKHKKAVAYYAYIIPKTADSGEQIWVTSQRIPHPRVKKCWGKRIYEIVTGDATALEAVWNALPIAIKDLTKKGKRFSEAETKQLQEFFAAAFQE